MVLKAAQAVVVAVINPFLRAVAAFLCMQLSILPFMAQAAVLDDDRIDILYQSYEGGGTEVVAPAIVVRKKIAESFAISGSYLVDMVSGASIDVEVGASAYEEERTEYSVGLQYLHDKAILNLGYSQSKENDYLAKAYQLGISQDFFGDLTTLAMGINFGDNKISQTGAPNFLETAQSYGLDVGITQVITRNFIGQISFNKTIDEGYLQNPYRFIRYLDPNNPTLWLTDKERYPGTRSSDAVAIRGRYFLPNRHVIYAGFRQYQDSWGIKAQHVELGYALGFIERWLFDASLRFYQQSDAHFYRDLFDYAGQFNHMARDKELSRFSNWMFSTSAAYELPIPANRLVKKSSVHVFYNYINFDYKNFRDARVTNVDAGDEPLYQFDAHLIRLMLSVWF